MRALLLLLFLCSLSFGSLGSKHGLFDGETLCSLVRLC